MPDFQSHVFARGLVNASRRIIDVPSGHRLRECHGHTFRVTVSAPLRDAGPAEFEKQLRQCVAPLDFSYLNDVVDDPADERLTRWIKSRFEPANSTLNVGVRSAEPWTSTIDNEGLVLVSHEFQFNASHWLPNVPAGHQCARLHGHHFSVIISVRARAFPENSMLLYDLIARHWHPIKQQLQGHCLNDIPGLENPTSELLALWLWQKLEDSLPGLATISICETVTAGCSFDGAVFRIWKDQRFESAFDNPMAAGENKVSGRGYLLRLNLVAPLDETAGWVYDFGEVKESFKPFMQRLDHRHLNELAIGDGINSKELAEWLMEQLPKKMPRLDRIDLFDSSTAGLIVTNTGQSPQFGYPLV